MHAQHILAGTVLALAFVGDALADVAVVIPNTDFANTGSVRKVSGSMGNDYDGSIHPATTLPVFCTSHVGWGGGANTSTRGTLWYSMRDENEDRIIPLGSTIESVELTYYHLAAVAPYGSTTNFAVDVYVSDYGVSIGCPSQGQSNGAYNMSSGEFAAYEDFPNGIQTTEIDLGQAGIDNVVSSSSGFRVQFRDKTAFMGVGEYSATVNAADCKLKVTYTPPSSRVGGDEPVAVDATWSGIKSTF